MTAAWFLVRKERRYQNFSDTKDTLTQASDRNCNVELESKSGSSVNVSETVLMREEGDDEEPNFLY